MEDTGSSQAVFVTAIIFAVLALAATIAGLVAMVHVAVTNVGSGIRIDFLTAVDHPEIFVGIGLFLLGINLMVYTLFLLSLYFTENQLLQKHLPYELPILMLFIMALIYFIATGSWPHFAILIPVLLMWFFSRRRLNTFIYRNDLKLKHHIGLMFFLIAYSLLVILFWQLIWLAIALLVLIFVVPMVLANMGEDRRVVYTDY